MTSVDNIEISINKSLSKKFKYTPKKRVLEKIIDDIIQSSFVEIGKKFSNKMNEYTNLNITNNDNKQYLGTYVSDSFIALGASSKHFKISSIGDRKPNKYNENLSSFTFGYSKRIYDKYEIWLNTSLSVGKMEKIIFKDAE